jgi:hypothetical protein
MVGEIFGIHAVISDPKIIILRLISNPRGFKKENN